MSMGKAFCFKSLIKESDEEGISFLVKKSGEKRMIGEFAYVKVNKMHRIMSIFS